MSPEKRLLILRHGETDGNANRIMQTPETPLNQLGLEQAQLAAQRIVEEFGTDLVIRSSDYVRAHQTASALAELSDKPIVIDELLRERNLGDLRGRRYADLGFDPFAPEYHPPGGESWEQFFERVEALYQALPSQLDVLPLQHTLVLVTHGLVCRVLAKNHLNQTRLRFPSDTDPATSVIDHWPNTSLTAIEITGDSWSAVAFNCGRHLEVLGGALQPRGPA